MKHALVFLSLAATLVFVRCPSAKAAEQHRATSLGNPATRFAPPLQSPEDLRSRFRDEKLKPDIASILRQWRWTGNVEDLHRAALTAEITEWDVPVGYTMPFMSSRKNGHPLCLISVLWAGNAPAPAYAFNFTSKGRRYRCITPKACSNFFLEELGAEPLPVLALTCTAPAEVLLGRPVEICLSVQNIGNAAESKVNVTLQLPPEAKVSRATGSGTVSGDRVTWEIGGMASNATKQVCVILAPGQAGAMPFSATAAGALARPVQTSCATKAVGIPAILIETVDLADPIEVGKEVTYEIKVTNQGSAPDTNIRISCILPASQEFVSATGTTTAHVQERRVVMDPLPRLDPKGLASWRVVVKAAAADDARFKVELGSDQFEQPITEEEPTRQY